MIKKISYFIVAIFISMCALAEEGFNITPGDIKIVRMHSTHHSNANAQKMALMQIDGLVAPCNYGVFWDVTKNPETLSIALSSIVAKSSGRIGYEPTMTSPWGDKNYCALTYFDIK
mgnify:CR=1 FL=1